LLDINIAPVLKENLPVLWKGYPTRRATWLGVSASDDGAVNLGQCMLVVLLARASNTDSICTPICKIDRQTDKVMLQLAIDNETCNSRHARN
jgi:hypothetical protein